MDMEIEYEYSSTTRCKRVQQNQYEHFEFTSSKFGTLCVETCYNAIMSSPCGVTLNGKSQQWKIPDVCRFLLAFPGWSKLPALFIKT